MRFGLERELESRIPAKHPLIAWLVRHAANVLTWAVKGQDGKTAYHRVRGKPFCTRFMTFGEQCRYKMRSPESFSASGDGRRFHVGTQVGVDRRTRQYMIHSGDGILYVRTVLRLPEPNKWNKDELAKIRATPGSLHVPKDTEVAFKHEKEVEKTYEIKTQKIGVADGYKEKGKVLNRVIRRTGSGWEVEADPRHAELVVEQLAYKI